MRGEPAARSADELALLRGLTARPGDALVLGVYNDWLEEHADPRGEYLRRFLAAFDNGTPLPERPAGVSPGWDELVGLGVRRRLRELGATVELFEPHLPLLLNSGQPCIQLELQPPQSMSSVPPGASRAGGVADLPIGAAWPMCDDHLGGRWPMQFLLQINLEELAGTLCEGVLPDAGLLSLFYYPENEPRGLEIRYSPPDATLEPANPPEPYMFHPMQIGNVRFTTRETRSVRLVEAMRYPEWLDEFDELPEELSDFNLADDGRLGRVLLGEPAGKRHYFATHHRRNVCPYWSPTGYFKDVPVSHVELFELADEPSLHWLFVDNLHVFVDRVAARNGTFGPATWGML